MMLKVGTIWYQYDDVKLKLELSLTHHVTPILFICYFTNEAHNETIGLVPMDAACWLSWGEGIKTPYPTSSTWKYLSIVNFHSFLLLFWFIILQYAADHCVYWYQSCFICIGLTYEIYSGDSPSTYVYCPQPTSQPLLAHIKPNSLTTSPSPVHKYDGWTASLVDGHCY